MFWNWQNVNKTNNWENKHGKRWTACGKKKIKILLSLAYSNPNVKIELFSVAIICNKQIQFIANRKKSYNLLFFKLVAILDCFHGNRCCKLWNLTFFGIYLTQCLSHDQKKKKKSWFWSNCCYCVWPVGCMGILFVSQGWDSSTFTRISVEQKLKSVVDDDQFRGKKEKKIWSNPSLYLACPHSAVFSSYSRMCARCIILAFKNDHANIITRGLFTQGLFIIGLTPSQPWRFNVEWCTQHWICH